MADALFERSEEGVVPTALSRGPWSPQALHGGPVAGLVAWAVEPWLVPAAGVPEGRHVVRLTVDLVQPVPLAPLTVRAQIVRPGRRLQVVDVKVEASGRVVTLGRAVCVRRLTPDQAPTPSVDDRRHWPPPVDGLVTVAIPAPWPMTVFHTDAVESRPVSGGFGSRTPGTSWMRLRYPVVAGSPLTGLQRVAAISDFASGLSSEVAYGVHSFINADISLSLIRPLVGEWVGVDARTHYGEPGAALALAAVWDETGRIGSIAQSMIIDEMG